MQGVEELLNVLKDLTPPILEVLAIHMLDVEFCNYALHAMETHITHSCW